MILNISHPNKISYINQNPFFEDSILNNICLKTDLEMTKK